MIAFRYRPKTQLNKLQKEGHFIAKKTESCFNLAVPSFNQIKSQEMQALVCRAQNNEQEAIDELCRMFKPLIYREAKRQTVFDTLGEDAINIAWVIFLSFIKRYQGKEFAKLPGMIQCVLHYELIHAMQKENITFDNEVNSEEVLEQQSYDVIEENFTKLLVQEALDTLPTKQSKILEMYYAQNKNHKQIAQVIDCSERHVKRLKSDAMKTIKQKLKSS